MRKAFTLAEILITLGIIGVVAAMTIPALINNYNEKQWINKLKQTYTILSQATISVINEYGGPESWELQSYDPASADKIIDYYSHYIKIAHDGGPSSLKSCRTPFFSHSYLTLNGQKENSSLFNNGGYHCIILPNGVSLGIAAMTLRSDIDNSNFYAYILTDVNGDKSPNTLGKDIFYLYLRQKGIVNENPIISGYDLWWVNQDSCSKTKKQAWTPGGACALWVLKHWNLDYLHREIPSSEWKFIN